MQILLLCLSGLVLWAVGSPGADVPWLSEVTTPPVQLPPSTTGTILPLLVDRNGNSIGDLAAWEVRRREILEDWLKFLGPMPHPPPEVKWETLQTEHLPELVRSLVRYEGEPGLFVEGYLLVPTGIPSGEKRAGIVALHQTTDASIDEIAGVSGPDDMQIGLKLARRGFVVFCPRCFLWQDVDSLDDAVEKHHMRHPETTGMAKMLYDAQRGVDLLVSLPQVDQRRIGAIGHSLGGKEVLYLAAFDERVKVAVSSEGGLTFGSTNWHAPWYLTTAIREQGFLRNHHELLGLIAPRPFLILGGEIGPGAADGDRSWPLIEAALPAWQLYCSPARLGLLNHRQGHSISPESFERMAEWLEFYLTK